jgi:hypothetical protein
MGKLGHVFNKRFKTNSHECAQEIMSKAAFAAKA